MRKVPISMLTPDMKLAKPIYNQRSLLVKEGTSNLKRFADTFAKLGINHLIVEDAASQGIELQEALSDTTRERCMESLYITFIRFRHEGIVDLGQVRDIVERMIEEIIGQMDILVSLDDIRSTDDDTLVHSINTTIYALLIGSQLGYGYNGLKELAEGVILHDIGKTLLDKKILFKQGRLTRAEFEYVKTHTTLGYQCLKEKENLSELSRRIALSHHEYLDGSGYPEQRKGNEIHEYVRIATIADIYESLTSDRCYHNALPACQAVEILLRSSADRLDAGLVARFMQNIAIYPNGSMVKLSNGTRAIVKNQNTSMPFRPVVRVIQGKGKRLETPFDLDLLHELNVTIVDEEVSDLITERMKAVFMPQEKENGKELV